MTRQYDLALLLTDENDHDEGHSGLKCSAMKKGNKSVNIVDKFFIHRLFSCIQCQNTFVASAQEYKKQKSILHVVYL